MPSAVAPVVLLVEDNLSMRALIRSLIEPVGAAVYECGDGETALTLYGRLRPDWVLMDIRMPGLDGIAATRALTRADPRARVIIVTEHREEQYRRAATSAGAAGFVLKDDLSELPRLLAGAGAGPAAGDGAP